MSNDPLDVLLRMRRLAVDQARQALADCVGAETVAGDRCAAIAAAIARELTDASKVTADDRAVEDFAVWLRQTLPDQTAAEAALLAAETRTEEARLVLAASRAGVRAIETMLERKAALRIQEAARAEQFALEEAVRLPRR
jgi:hypothetical protein